MSDAFDRLAAALADRYRIERELGEGGMATVYLARDLKHDRDVAIKVLKPELAAVLGAERFVQEIATTAQLQHPNILPLFDSGEADGFLYYVMPYVEGESLRDRLDRERQLGVDEAVKLVVEVADALQYAHEQGVVHRDIKPENILLHAGRPVVADFGIALAVSAAAGGRMTETGLSLGTPHYMSPEQATAEKEITGKSDIYSLASVLYEMLAGDPPHVGASAQQIIVKIIADEPRPITELRKSVPPNVAAAVAKALEKLPADRFGSAAAFADALTDPAFTTAVKTADALEVHDLHVLGSRLSWRAVAGALGAISVAALAVAAWGWLRPPSSAPVVRYLASLTAGDVRNGVDFFQTVAISPDGGSLVFRDPAASAEGQLFVKRGGDLTPHALEGTDGGTAPFFSPNGAWIGYFAGGELRKVPSGGGGSLELADSVAMPAAPLSVGTSYVVSGAWLQDGSIYYSSVPVLRRVPATGGAPEQIVSPEDLGGRTPLGVTALPSSRGVLFTACTVFCDESQIDVYDARRDTVRVLFEDAIGAWYAPGGQVLYLTRTGTLVAVPWDNDALAPAGAPVPVLDGIQAPGFALSAGGTALYVLGPSLFESPRDSAEIVWVDRTGRVEPVDPSWQFNPSAQPGLALSPDGRRLAVRVLSNLGDDIWVKRLPTGPPSRLTFHDGVDRSPGWSADGQSVFFVSDRPTLPDTTSRGEYAVWKRAADGTGHADLLWAGESVRYAAASADGQWLVLRSGPVDINLFAIRPGTDSVARPLLVNTYRAFDPALSPDSRWLAYTSNEQGTRQVFIRPFPDVDRSKTQVSNGGGFAPVWAHNGRELFYRTPEGMNVVQIRPGPPLTVGQPRSLFARPDRVFRGTGEGLYALSPDDQRFLMFRGIRSPDTTRTVAPRLVIVQNFLQELRQKVKK